MLSSKIFGRHCLTIGWWAFIGVLLGSIQFQRWSNASIAGERPGLGVALSVANYFLLIALLTPGSRQMRAFGLHRLAMARIVLLSAAVSFVPIAISKAALFPSRLIVYEIALELGIVGLVLMVTLSQETSETTTSDASPQLAKLNYPAFGLLVPLACALVAFAYFWPTENASWYGLVGWVAPLIILGLATTPNWGKQGLSTWQAFGLPRREFRRKLWSVTALGFLTSVALSLVYAWKGETYPVLYLGAFFIGFTFILSMNSMNDGLSGFALVGVFPLVEFARLEDWSPGVWIFILWLLVLAVIAFYGLVNYPVKGNQLAKGNSQ